MVESETNADRLLVLVPEALLAAAKDVRYIDECQTLLQQLLDAFGLCSNENAATTISSILYALLVLLPRGKTLGMEVTGLKFDRLHYRLVALSVVSSLTMYALSKMKLTQDEDSTESLRGASRRDVFLRQREAMMNRTPQTRSTINDTSVSSSTQSRIMIRRFVRIISDALSPKREGPHFPPVELNVQRTWAEWLLRLHLAFYCMHGKYASWMHRLLGISYQQNEEGRIVHRPTMHRAIGALILSHALGTSVLSMSRRLIHMWFNFRTRFVIPDVPSTDNQRDVAPNATVTSSSSSSLVCGICHGKRKYPACPVDCGHVFCWTCLQKWVQTVRPECPLCRSPCAAKDVIPLYNYDISE